MVVLRTIKDQTPTDMAGRNYLAEYADSSEAQVHYNNAGQIWKQVDADGMVTLFQYNVKGEQEYVAVDMDRDDIIDFDGSDRITQTVSEAGAATIAGATGNVVRHKQYKWDTVNADNKVLTSVTETSVNSLKSWQSSFGLVAGTEAVLNVAVSPATKTTTTTAPDGSKTVNYHEDGRLISVTLKDATDAQLSQVAYGYDAHGRRQSVTDARNGVTTYTFDNADRITSVTTPDPDDAGPQQAQVTSFVYDSMGRRTQTTLPDSTVVNYSYGDTGELERTWGSRTYPVEYDYDSQGRMKTMTTWKDYAGQTGAAITTWSYDSSRGFLTSKTYADNDGPSYTYTDAGRLATRTWDRGLATSYSYGNAGELLTVDYADATPDIAYTYDRLGRQSTIVDAAGTRSFTYTGSQLTAENFTAGMFQDVAIAHGHDSLLRRNAFNAANGIVNLAQTTYTYDQASRFATISNGTDLFTYAYETNAPGLVASVVFNNGSSNILTTSKTYDKLNRLLTISSVSSLATVSTAYDHNDANQRIKAVLNDGSYWEYDYDALGQVVGGQKFHADDTPVSGMGFGYAFDDIGNREETTLSAPGQPVRGQSSYTTNNVNQYTARTVPGIIDVLGSAQPEATVTVNNMAATRKGSQFHRELTADNAENAVWQEVNIVGVRGNVGPAGEDAVTEKSGHIFVPGTPEQFVYDTDGNLLSDGRWSYVWNAENRLVQMETSAALPAFVPRRRLEFSYDYMGRRIRKTVSEWDGQAWQETSDIAFIYDGWNLIAELDANNSNACLDKFVWGIDLSGSLQGAGGVGGLLACTTSNATPETLYYAYDGNGNVMALISPVDGTVKAEYEYSPFGRTLRVTGDAAEGNAYRFSTKYLDSETGLYYYGLRYYNPGLGRWVSRDPIGEDGGVNLYSFVYNSTITLYDPIGLQASDDPCCSGGRPLDCAALKALWHRLLKNQHFELDIYDQATQQTNDLLFTRWAHSTVDWAVTLTGLGLSAKAGAKVVGTGARELTEQTLVTSGRRSAAASIIRASRKAGQELVTKEALKLAFMREVHRRGANEAFKFLVYTGIIETAQWGASHGAAAIEAAALEDVRSLSPPNLQTGSMLLDAIGGGASTQKAWNAYLGRLGKKIDRRSTILENIKNIHILCCQGED